MEVNKGVNVAGIHGVASGQSAGATRASGASASQPRTVAPLPADPNVPHAGGIDVVEIADMTLLGDQSLQDKVMEICQSGRVMTDIHVKPGSPLMLKTPAGYLPYDNTPVSREQVEELLSMNTIGGQDWQTKMREGGGKIERAINLNYTGHRLRVAAFEEGGEERNPNIVFRVLTQNPMPYETTGAPRRLLEMVESGRGLMLITGPTGSGKTTTMASLLDHINMNYSQHILTIEDPIEYVFPEGKSLVSQREVGTNVPSFADGLRGAMRQRPNILAIGEVMDRQTVDTMLLAAESGHFVIATTHTSSVEDTINRLLSFYDTNERLARQVTLASTLVGIVGQALVPSLKKERYYLATEVMVNTSAVANMIRKGEFHGIRNLIRQGARDGMQDMNAELMRMVSRNDIHYDAARYASSDPDNLRNG